MNNRSKLFGMLVAITILITYFCVLDRNIFEVYAMASLGVHSGLVALFFLICRKSNKAYVGYIIVFAVYILGTLLINPKSGIGSMITFAISVFTAISLEKAEYTYIIRKIISASSIVLLWLMFIISFNYAEDYYGYTATHMNPNTIGMFLMLSYMIYIVMHIDRGRLLEKVLKILYAGIALFGMLNCSSRGAMLAFVFFLGSFLIPQGLLNARLVRLLTIVLLVCGTIIPFVYVFLYKSGINIVIMGKSLFTGRERLWMNMFEFLGDSWKNWLFGLGSKIELWEYDLNTHNNYFNVIINFGIIGYVLYYGFLLSRVYFVSKYISNISIKRALMMFIAVVFVLGFTETTSFWSVIFVFCYFGLGFAINECEKIDDSLKHKNQL